jgi:hypothetical protein
MRNRDLKRVTVLAIAGVFVLTACAPDIEVESSRGALLAVPAVPAGWTAVAGAAKAASSCWVRTVAAGKQYVCAADLRGARIATAHGAFKAGTPPRTAAFLLTSFGTLCSSATPAGMSLAFCANLSFFSRSGSYSGTAFPYKTPESALPQCIGYETSNPAHAGYMRILSIWPDRGYLDIGPYDGNLAAQTGLEAYGSAPTIIGGVDPADPGPPDHLFLINSTSIARTMLAAADLDRSGSRETLMLFSGPATTAAGEAVLRSFGADRVMNVDGGSSYSLRLPGISCVGPCPTLPNVLVVSSP